MLNLTLDRHWFTLKSTIGKLYVDGQFHSMTLELPWNEGRNIPRENCIPEGAYDIVLEHSPKFNRLLPELKGVPGRTEIKIHPANFPKELLGCIAPGTLRGEDVVWSSKVAFDPLFKAVSDELSNEGGSVRITIVNKDEGQGASHIKRPSPAPINSPPD